MATTTRSTPDTVQSVAVNLYTTDSAMVVVAPMPGVTTDDLDVSVDGRILNLSARLRTEAPKEYVIHEFDYGSYRRLVDLPAEPAGEPTISLGNGLLAVSIPRASSRLHSGTA
jgi:HSP20 family protein